MKGPRVLACPRVLVLAMTWSYRFRPFTTFHLVMVLACAALVFGACRYGRETRQTAAERRFRLAWGWSIVAFGVFSNIWWAIPGHHAPDGRLPLHLCRVATWVAAAAMLTGARPWRAVLFFWGLGLCVQGLVTPLRLDGFASVGFWIFWVGHLQIVGSAVYDVVVLGFRPVVRDLRAAVLASWAYIAVVVPVNLVFDLDYGYLGRGEYRTRNVLDHLPPWPWRPVCFIAIAHGVLVLLWAVAQAISPGQREEEAVFEGAPADPAA